VIVDGEKVEGLEGLKELKENPPGVPLRGRTVPGVEQQVGPPMSGLVRLDFQLLDQLLLPDACEQWLKLLLDQLRGQLAFVLFDRYGSKHLATAQEYKKIFDTVVKHQWSQLFSIEARGEPSHCQDHSCCHLPDDCLQCTRWTG
jgi:hypothetical protein